MSNEYIEAPKQYEYILLTLLVSPGKIQSEINNMSEKGWRLVAVGSHGLHYFEREIQSAVTTSPTSSPPHPASPNS